MPRWVRAGVFGFLTLDFVVLLVTGVILFFEYQPSWTFDWTDVYSGDGGGSADLVRGTTAVHRAAALAAVPLAVAAGVLVVVERWSPSPSRPRARRRGVTVGVGLVAVVLLGSFTGTLLPWDQVGLHAVTVGSDLDGYWPLFESGRVRFAIVDGAEIAPGTMIRWLLVHTVVVGAALSALLAVAWRRPPRVSEGSEVGEGSERSEMSQVSGG